MGTIAEKLNYLNETKIAIKDAIINKGVSVSDKDTFRSYANKIQSIQTGGGSGTNGLQWKCDNMKSLAYECYKSSLNNVDEMFNGLDTSQVTDMSRMFDSCGHLTSLDLSSFNTSQVTGMGSMFANCSSLTSLDLSSFNTSKVTNISYIFSSCRALPSLDLSSFNTANATDMSYMFYDCRALPSLDLSSFNTANATNMSAMFQHCNNLTSLDLSSFNTSKVTNMGSMFNNCSSLTSLDLSNFDTSKVTGMGYVFSGCSSLTQILGSLDLIKTTSLVNTFSYCTALTTFTLKNIKLSLTIGSGTSYGTLLDDPTIINTAKELWDLTGTTSQKLTVATAVSAKLDTIYVKLIAATEEMIANDPNITSKKPCEVCQSTDEGAMTLREYIVSKNWTISG